MVKDDALDVLAGHLPHLLQHHSIVDVAYNEACCLVIKLGNPASADKHISRGVLWDTLTRCGVDIGIEVDSIAAYGARPRPRAKARAGLFE